jgi:hypothetical protein
MSDGLSERCNCAERLGVLGHAPIENRPQRLVCGHVRFGEPVATTGLGRAREMRSGGERSNPSGSSDVRFRSLGFDIENDLDIPLDAAEALPDSS